MKSLLFTLTTLAFTCTTYAQTGEISGKIMDENGDGIPQVSVAFIDSSGRALGIGTTADFDGNYSIKALPASSYNVQFSYPGHSTFLVKGVLVNAGKIKWINPVLIENKTRLEEIELRPARKWLIPPDTPSFK